MGCILHIMLCAGYPTTDSCTKLSNSSVETDIQQCLIHFLSVFIVFHWLQKSNSIFRRRIWSIRANVFIAWQETIRKKKNTCIKEDIKPSFRSNVCSKLCIAVLYHVISKLSNRGFSAYLNEWAVATRSCPHQGHTFLFCSSSSCHPSVPSCHYSPSCSVTSHFSLVFSLALSWFRPCCAGSWEAACTRVPLSWAMLWGSIPSCQDTHWLCRAHRLPDDAASSVHHHISQSLYLVVLLSIQGVRKFPRSLYPGP